MTVMKDHVPGGSKLKLKPDFTAGSTVWARTVDRVIASDIYISRR
jgi:hypothetical protein